MSEAQLISEVRTLIGHGTPKSPGRNDFPLYWDSQAKQLYTWDGVTWNVLGLQKAAVTLTAAQIRNLRASPVLLIPAPGAGKGNVLQSIAFQYKPGAAPFDLSGGASVLVGPLNQSGPAANLPATGVLDGLTPKMGLTIASPAISDIQFQTAFNPSLLDDAATYVWTTATFDVGSIATYALASGTGYSAGDSVTISGGGNGDAVLHIDTVNGGGVVLTSHLTNAGTDYETIEGPLATTGGSGTGLTLTVNSINSLQAGDGSLRVTVVYSVVELI